MQWADRARRMIRTPMRASKWMLIGPLLCATAGAGLVLGTGTDEAPRALPAEDVAPAGMPAAENANASYTYVPC